MRRAILFSTVVTCLIYGFGMSGHAASEPSVFQRIAATETYSRVSQWLLHGMAKLMASVAEAETMNTPMALVDTLTSNNAAREAGNGETAAGSLSHDEILHQIGRIYRYQSDVLTAEAEGRREDMEPLLNKSISELGILIQQPNILSQPSFQALFRTVVTEYEKYYGIPADTLVLPGGDIYELQDAMFTALNDVDSPQLEDVQLPNVRPVDTTIPMTVNRLVEKSIRYLLEEKLDEHIYKWLSRAHTYFPMIEQILAEENMPDELKYLAMVESGLNPNARSWAQAVGMWQFIASTGRSYDLHVNSWVDERRDPEKATRAAAQYIRFLYNKYRDWHLALAAYNCGPGNVDKAIRRQRQQSSERASFWNIYNYLPRETRNYVPLFIATALITSNPSAFKVTATEPGPPYAYDIIALRGALSLKDIAELAGTDVSTIQALNPALRRSSLPPGTAVYPVRIPFGAHEAFIARYAQMPASQKNLIVLEHIVRRGDTLSELAIRYGVTTDALRHTNGLESTRIRIGQRLSIPVPRAGGDRVQPVLADMQPKRVQYGSLSFRPITSNEPVNASATTSTTASQTGDVSSQTTYRVRRGDTLSSIASRRGTSIARIKQWNNLSGSIIRIGQRLILFPTNEVASSNTYRVRRGDSLSRIAQQHGVTVAHLKLLNNLQSSVIHVGQQLTIRT